MNAHTLVPLVVSEPRWFVRLPAFDSPEEALSWCSANAPGERLPRLHAAQSAHVVGCVEVTGK
jgi:hypothetical protein